MLQLFHHHGLHFCIFSISVKRKETYKEVFELRVLCSAKIHETVKVNHVRTVLINKWINKIKHESTSPQESPFSDSTYQTVKVAVMFSFCKILSVTPPDHLSLNFFLSALFPFSKYLLLFSLWLLQKPQAMVYWRIQSSVVIVVS